MTKDRSRHAMWPVLALLCGLGILAQASGEAPPASDLRGRGQVITTDSGLQYVDLVVGHGEQADIGDTATVHYTGWLKDGTQFDSSRERGEPYSFQLGSHQVIPGWNEGLTSMREGGKRRLIIPPHLGYGARGVEDIIPPNATLIFEVELLDLR